VPGWVEPLFLNLKSAILGVAGGVLPAGVMPVVSAALSCTAILLFAPLTMMYLTLLERKVVARIQDRIGPNRVGPWGLLQPLADGVKMVLKEDIIPVGADKLVHFLTPVLSVSPVLMLFLVLPFGQGMIASNLNVGVLFFLALSSVHTPLAIAAGWGARSKFSVLGGMRAAAQLLSYEIPMVVVVIAVVMISGSMNMGEIVEAQQKTGWYGFTPWGACAFVIFIIAATAESNRTPFDMSEAESELVAGFHTEYSGFKFALFQMGEFLSAFATGGMAVALFFGGWLPLPLLGGLLPSWMWFFLKTLFIFIVLIWFRGTLPRFRIDQLLAIAWKFLFPLSLLVIVAAAAWQYLAVDGQNLLGAWAFDGVILLAGYWALTTILFNEFERINRPRNMSHAR